MSQMFSSHTSSLSSAKHLGGVCVETKSLAIFSLVSTEVCCECVLFDAESINIPYLHLSHAQAYTLAKLCTLNTSHRSAFKCSRLPGTCISGRALSQSSHSSTAPSSEERKDTFQSARKVKRGSQTTFASNDYIEPTSEQINVEFLCYFYAFYMFTITN